MKMDDTVERKPLTSAINPVPLVLNVDDYPPGRYSRTRFSAKPGSPSTKRPRASKRLHC